MGKKENSSDYRVEFKKSIWEQQGASVSHTRAEEEFHDKGGEGRSALALREESRKVSRNRDSLSVYLSWSISFAILSEI